MNGRGRGERVLKGPRKGSFLFQRISPEKQRQVFLAMKRRECVEDATYETLEARIEKVDQLVDDGFAKLAAMRAVVRKI